MDLSRRFALKTRQRLLIFGDLIGQELEGHKTMESDVFGLVDDTHPASAELLDDAVVGDGLAEQWGEILGSGVA